MKIISQKLGMNMSRNKTFYKTGKMLGLNTRDINDMLAYSVEKTEYTHLEAGPPMYPCSFYGTISIKDF